MSQTIIEPTHPLISGGPIYPVYIENVSDSNFVDRFGTLLAPDTAVQYTGVTLRDLMAIAAMQGLLAVPGNLEVMDTPERARYAYLQADALLVARR